MKMVGVRRVKVFKLLFIITGILVNASNTKELTPGARKKGEEKWNEAIGLYIRHGMYGRQEFEACDSAKSAEQVLINSKIAGKNAKELEEMYKEGGNLVGSQLGNVIEALQYVRGICALGYHLTCHPDDYCVSCKCPQFFKTFENRCTELAPVAEGIFSKPPTGPKCVTEKPKISLTKYEEDDLEASKILFRYIYDNGMGEENPCSSKYSYNSLGLMMEIVGKSNIEIKEILISKRDGFSYPSHLKNEFETIKSNIKAVCSFKDNLVCVDPTSLEKGDDQKGTCRSCNGNLNSDAQKLCKDKVSKLLKEAIVKLFPEEAQNGGWYQLFPGETTVTPTTSTTPEPTTDEPYYAEVGGGEAGYEGSNKRRNRSNRMTSTKGTPMAGAIILFLLYFV